MITTPSLTDLKLTDKNGNYLTDHNGTYILASVSSWDIGVAEPSRMFRARFKLAGSVLDCSIVKVDCYKGACADSFGPGSMYVPYIKAVIKECSRELDGVELLYQIGLRVGEEYEYIDIGYFTVTDPKVTTSQIEFKAVGRLAKGNTEYVSLLSYPAAITDVIAEISAAIGVPVILRGLTGTGLLETIPDGTHRDALSTIAGCLGGFVSEDNAGNIVISAYGYGLTISANPDRSLSLPETWEKAYTVTGIKVTVPDQTTDEGNIPGATYTAGTPVIDVTNPCMTRALFREMYQNIRGYTFTPANVDLSLGDPRLEPWDTVAVIDLEGNVHAVPCFEVIHTFHGGLSTQINAEIVSPSAASLQVTGPVGKLITQHENTNKKRYNLLSRTISELSSVIGEVDPESGTLQTQITQNKESIRQVAENLSDNYYSKTEVDLTAEGLDTKISTKRRVFRSSPLPPYDVGDMWVQGLNGDILVCSRARAENDTYSDSDWVRASKYTDDSTANTEIDARRTLIRDFSGGTITAFVGNPIGVYTNASGSVDIVQLAWSDDEPTIVKTLASYSATGIDNDPSTAYVIGTENTYIRFDPVRGIIDIGGNVEFNSTKTLSQLLSQLNSEQIVVQTDYTDAEVQFTAKLVRAGEDITTEYEPSDYEWYHKTRTDYEFIGTGYSISVDKEDLTLGRSVVCRWVKREYLYLTDKNGNYITDKNGNRILVKVEVS